jgi:hypothetical protein
MGEIAEEQQREEPESEGAKALKDSANMFAAFVTATTEAEDRRQEALQAPETRWEVS